MRAVRTATINNNDPSKCRVRLELRKIQEGYCWFTSDDEDCGLGCFKSVKEALNSACLAWGADIWNLRASWL